ncbi:hypothetical protein FDH76_gp44 [Propionibacterium phage PHL117M01]|uniref:Uncharacterized protein n=2 Tax=Pahexavirus PHL117M01 TaxID=1982290 RepID=A0A0E3DME8_9CAUD|nr:hypothetical protein FDH76_gp44 [Propionibacterium phage PHL117M01]AII28850.1 hypothetical protein PHL064M01_44 [Propionibacterium phage PHL064M01]AII28896.1 hypothetical protein PHL064M02_44 [Propionibacterium phage PHL064M02]AII29579.1 hypothetical protein PHL117M01_44 [Propionibacterium phage PHL117M01]
MVFRRVSRVLGRKLPSHTLHTLTPVSFLGLACSAEGVRRVTLTPLT